MPLLFTLASFAFRVANLIMTPDELSRLHETLGNAVTKLISEHARALESLPVTSRATPDDLKKLFEEPLPLQGAPAHEILDKFARVHWTARYAGPESSLLWPVQSDAFGDRCLGRRAIVVT